MNMYHNKCAIHKAKRIFFCDSPIVLGGFMQKQTSPIHIYNIYIYIFIYCNQRKFWRNFMSCACCCLVWTSPSFGAPSGTLGLVLGELLRRYGICGEGLGGKRRIRVSGVKPRTIVAPFENKWQVMTRTYKNWQTISKYHIYKFYIQMGPLEFVIPEKSRRNCENKNENRVVASDGSWATLPTMPCRS